MIINIRQCAKDLKYKNPDLITRPIGRNLFAKVLEKLEIIGLHEIVIIDFEGIKVIDSSFIDEFLVRLILLSRDEKKPFYVKLRNISESAEINIDLVFKSYSHYNNKKIVVISDELRHNNSYFIGPLTGAEKQIIDFLKINKSARVSEIADILSLPEEETMEIMEQLFETRVIRKDTQAIFSVV